MHERNIVSCFEHSKLVFSFSDISLVYNNKFTNFYIIINNISCTDYFSLACFRVNFFWYFISTEEYISSYGWKARATLFLHFKINHYSKVYSKVPLVHCTNYFWCTFDRENQIFLHGDFYLVINSRFLSK